MANLKSPDQRVIAFYTLLAEIYERPIKFSNLLTMPQVSPNQVREWIKDTKWVANYLNKFLQSLISELQTNFPDFDANIITLSYGLGEENKIHTVKQIADQTNLPVQIVRDIQKNF